MDYYDLNKLHKSGDILAQISKNRVVKIAITTMYWVA